MSFVEKADDINTIKPANYFGKFILFVLKVLIICEQNKNHSPADWVFSRKGVIETAL
jgi:hypothetical protein